MLESIIISIVLVAIIFLALAKKTYFYIKERLFLKRLAKSGIQDIDKMDGHQFEVYLKALLKELGYKPEVTKKSNDFGADLVLKGKNRIVIQAKRYGFRNKVGIGAVQEIYAAQKYYDAEEGWVITNSMFTKSANQLAVACNVKLFNRYDLVQFINSINSEVTPLKIYQEEAPAKRSCKCGEIMVVRISSDGNRFFGCSTYPSCKHTESINRAKCVDLK